MWERYCVGLHGVCQDGHPVDSELYCSMWDTINNECTMVKSMQVTADSQKQLAELKLVNKEFFAERIKAAKGKSG